MMLRVSVVVAAFGLGPIAAAAGAQGVAPAAPAPATAPFTAPAPATAPPPFAARPFVVPPASAASAAPGAPAAPATSATSATSAAPSEPAAPQTGLVNYYGRKFAGRRTASGERFDPEAMTMSHRSLPFGTRVRVTNLANGESVIVRVNDRLPTGSARIGDLSEAAAERIGMIRAGAAEVRLEVLRVITSR